MANYRIIKSGKNERREYLPLNRSRFFEALPEIDIGKEQRLSYYKFIEESLPKMLKFYFPLFCKDHNNTIDMDVLSINVQDPDISEEEASENSLTWASKIFFKWKADWKCHGINIPIKDGKEDNFIEDIKKWVEESFKIGNFDIDQVEYENKNSSCDNGSYELKKEKTWEIKEKKGELKISLQLKEQKENHLFVSFRYQQTKEILFCNLPKISDRGTFIINGHRKVVVYQSVRAPSIYFFFSKERGYYAETIAFKGPWINISQSSLNNQIELKFLNSKKIIKLKDIFNFFDISSDLLNLLSAGTEVNWEDGIELQEDKKKQQINNKKTENLAWPNSWAKFLFTEKNSYFEFGNLGRKKFNAKALLKKRLMNQIIAEDIFNLKNELILNKNTLMNDENIETLQHLLETENINLISLPNSTNELNWVKIKSPIDLNKTITVIGIVSPLPEEKVYFDVSDLFLAVSLFLNSQQGVGDIDLEENKDKLDNQIIRRVGDLLHNIFDSKLGGFLFQDMPQRYLANISQLKKTDLAKMPNIQEINNSIRSFFNTSPLVQLQNQTNTLSESAHTKKTSVLGLGGFSADNTTLAARNVDVSHYARFGLMSSPDGVNFGLNHNFTLRSIVNEYGQIAAPYYRVKNGVVTPDLIYLVSEEEPTNYISHSNIRINEKNEILDEEVQVRYKGGIIKVKREMVNFIDSSFYHLTTIEEAVSPCQPNDDVTRRMIASNMQRSVISPLKNEEPLVSTGIEPTLFENSTLTIRTKKDGKVIYVDSNQIVVQEKNNEKEVYNLKQLLITNKDILSPSVPLVKVGDIVSKSQIIAGGYFAKNFELSLGFNLRTAYMSCAQGYEDSVLVSDELIKNDLFTYTVVKEYVISRYNTNLGEEVFSNSLSLGQQTKYDHLDKDGIVKVGSELSENSILVRKLIPQIDSESTEEDLLLLKILGSKGQKYTDSSLYLPKGGGAGIVYKVERKEGGEKDVLEVVKIYVAYKRKPETGDKFTNRYGNKGVIQIIPQVDMPYDEFGPIQMVVNSMSVPSRLNMSQAKELVLAEAAYRLNKKIIIKPFNDISLETLQELTKEAGITNMCNSKLYDGKSGACFDNPVFVGRIYTLLLNHKVIDKIHARSTGPYSLIQQHPLKGRKKAGGIRIGEMEVWALEAHGCEKIRMRNFSSDDITKRNEIENSLMFDKRKINLLYNRNESFNLVIQFMRSIGFDVQAEDHQGKVIDFYKYFSKN